MTGRITLSDGLVGSVTIGYSFGSVVTEDSPGLMGLTIQESLTYGVAIPSYWWAVGAGRVGYSRIWDGISPDPITSMNIVDTIVGNVTAIEE